MNALNRVWNRLIRVISWQIRESGLAEPGAPDMSVFLGSIGV